MSGISPASDLCFELKSNESCNSRMNTTAAEECINKNRIVLALFHISMTDKINSLPFFKTANMITGLRYRSPTPSQMIIGVMLRVKKLIRHFTSLRCLCDDDLRYRSFAAIDSMKAITTKLIHASDNDTGLIKSYTKMQRYIFCQNYIKSAFHNVEGKILHDESGKKKGKMLEILCMMILACVDIEVTRYRGHKI